ncbi:S8 family serine peptidase [Gloeocapsopsis sp. IPPAS B-1203]|uniref:S8 family serine peptidase n=1 Tax=Gloeocapsopsis sp. IPPAS B-1203 TaxID=2049454 RepID=UPI000C18935B|nr:S8 family serine peptidase [Gloeocapsopsis sp. IPPAS B-1203]PIG92119.1 peptidase S8 and S53 subtilisin kexin sedolisin [Gloeocapsopsis sp. IPPAS B-1203]
MLRKYIWILGGLSASCVSIPVLALETTSVGNAGIDALRLHDAPYNLIGRKIGIGQVEIGRPGQFGLDKAVTHKQQVSLAGVFLRNQPAKPNTNIDPHAQNVASVMVSTDKAVRGVAPGARLYSTAVGSLKTGGQPEECLSAQHVALQNGGDVRAINFSFGETLERDPRPNALLDGQALLTQCIDWSARVHNVMYAIAGNQGKGGIPIPTDNFNGINVAFTTRRQGFFTRIDVSNLSDAISGAVGGRLNGREVNLGPRRTVGIVAPGNKITLLNPNGKTTRVTGTSFAAPHVTATVALLQEFGDKQLRSLRALRDAQSPRQRNWTLDSRRQEVMKAVMLNSADKFQDPGNGLLLGMTKTILDKQNQHWLNSDAYRNPKIPLQAQMGTGQLNAYRAYQQFSAGQWHPARPVPAIGWDYRTLNVASHHDYVLAQPLQQDSFVSVTLNWNRLVELTDANNNRKFDIGETFRDRGLNNLDLYLLNADTNTIVDTTCTSTSEVDSVEHIFCRVPTSGKYKVRVQFQQQVNHAVQPYALAWWTVPAK